MRYMVDTIVNYILKESAKNVDLLRFVLPSYPSGILLNVGLKLEEAFSRMIDKRIRFRYGIAYNLCEGWRLSSNQVIKADFEVISSKGWFNEGNNMTSIRNEVKGASEDCLVVLIAGYNHIEDQAGMLDFFHLDEYAIWTICMRQSFYQWVENRLRIITNPDDSKEYYSKISDLFYTLYDNGLTDLCGISNFLEKHSFADVMSGIDAYKYVLERLSAFNLPSMLGLAGKNVNKRPSKYISSAQDFFNYSMFLDKSSRDRALKQIDKYKLNQASKEDVDSSTLGSFDSLEEMLESLKSYIDTKSSSVVQGLKSADFVFIYDKVLGYREPRIEKPPKPKKLEGMPLEVFLRAIWLSLGEYKKDPRSKSILLTEGISSITIKSLYFKHDFDAGEGSSAYDDNELAKNFLKRVLGGIDEYLEQQINIELGEKVNENSIEIRSLISPGESNDILSYKKSSTAEPALAFDVLITSLGEEEAFKRQFIWPIPQNHQCRIINDVYDLALNEYKKSGDALPAFGLPFITEIFMSREEDEVNRLVTTALQSGDFKMVDLLRAPGIEEKEELKKFLIDLSQRYQLFLREYEAFGFFTAIDKAYNGLRQAYITAYEKYLNSNNTSSLGPMLFKAFYIVNNDDLNQPGWEWNEYQQCAIITPLHPALLEMIKHQHAFLCESFCSYVENALKDSTDKLLAEKQWDRVTDLAKIQWPVFGTLKDKSLVIDTNVLSFGYIHLIGECKDKASFITSRTMLEYDVDEEDDIADSELFRETRASQLIERILMDYQKLHKHAEDGLSIGAYCGREIQPVISGIDEYLAETVKNTEDKLYSLKLTIFSDSRDDSAIMKWINAWKARWQEAEYSQGKLHYRNCRISISYRVIKKDKDFEQFKKLIKGVNFDVMFFTDFIEPSSSRFVPLGVNFQLVDDYRKFPVLEKSCCKLIGSGRDKHRERILSNQRFVLGSLHSEVMARLQNNNIEPGNRYAVISSSDYSPWESLINDAHKQCAWVVCIDPVVDADLLCNISNKGENNREIIGFGTGVGPHGENNYTVSTEQFSIVDIKKKVGQQISSRLGPLSKDDSEHIAESLVNEASNIGGLSVIRATGPSEYVRDYIAYALARKLLIKDKNAFCDELISLDAYRHWFDNTANAMRPDLLRLRAEIKDGYFYINAQIIECKLAQQSDGTLEKARQQIENGLKHLAVNFRPRQNDAPVGIFDKPDQRYWWMQMQRLIASKGHISKPKYNDALIALERLSEGYFSISWQACALAIWTDLERDDIRYSSDWNFSLEGQDVTISVANAGRGFIKKVCVDNEGTELFSNNISKLQYEYKFETKPQDSEYREDQLTINLKAEVERESQIDVNYKSFEVIQSNNLPRKGNEYRDEMQPMAEVKNKSISIHTPNVREVPKRVLLGSGTSGGRDIYWEFGHPDLPNRHILIFGASGTGKTYTIQAIISELSKCGQNSLIVDYTNGFTNKQLDDVVVEKLNPKQHIIRKEPLPINPFRQQCEVVDEIELEEDPAITAQRVSGVFEEVYNLGDQQKSALYNAIRDGLVNSKNNFSLKGLMEGLETIRSAGGPSANSAASVISKIQPFVDMNPFGEEDSESWEKLYTDLESRLHIIQLAGFMKETSRLITEFSLIDLYWYYRAIGNKNDPKVIILDEIQNLNHKLESPLGQFLTEGRKFGISLILATQTLSNLEKEEKDRLFQASHKLFFKPADTEVRSFAQILEDSVGGRTEEWIERLSSLKRGECYSLGPALNEGTGKLDVNKFFRIKIKPLNERF